MSDRAPEPSERVPENATESPSWTAPGLQLHFVTGRLAAPALEHVLQQIAERHPLRYTIDVLPITVAALMTPPWIARRIQVPSGTTHVLVPGYCQGDLAPIAEVAGGAVIVRGPRDLHDLPEFFGQPVDRRGYGAFTIEILAEINHAPRLERDEILSVARHYAESGADVIDVGCEPGDPWRGVGDCVKMLRDEGYRVSIDSLHPREIADACRAGAELVLSVKRHNRDAAPDWGCEVVVIPDDPADPATLDASIEWLAARGVSMRVDPIIEPIGCGFAASLGRYLDVRRRYPDVEMMMGIGNLTELTAADSAGINVVLLGFCEELRIRSVLTTEVINWARSSVRECDVARRLVHHAVARGVPPKHIDRQLVMLRDAKLTRYGPEQLNELAHRIRDHNYRLFAEDEQLHLVSSGMHLMDADPFVLFQQLAESGPHGGPPKNLDIGHAFYLGYETAKAVTAMTLGKNYRQDEALDWGLLTRNEVSHRRRSQQPPE